MSKIIRQAEAELIRLRLSVANDRGHLQRRILTIAGPPASGKSALVRNLSALTEFSGWSIYIEDPSGNPHYVSDSAESQDWFLDQYLPVTKIAHQNQSWILDQDPICVTLVYSKLLYNAGAISEVQYENHIQRAISLIKGCAAQKYQFTTIHLQADVAVLEQRLNDAHRAHALPLIESRALVDAFEHLFSASSFGIGIPSVKINTDTLSPKQVLFIALDQLSDTDGSL